MHFAHAIRDLNAGKTLARPHWPRGCFIGLALGAVDGLQRPFLVARSESGAKSPWIADEADFAADDWQIAQPLSGEEIEHARQRRMHELPED